MNGHDIKRLADAGSLTPDGRPVVVLCDTDAARGLDVLKARAPKMHYVRFTSEEEKGRYVAAYEELSAILHIRAEAKEGEVLRESAGRPRDRDQGACEESRTLGSGQTEGAGALRRPHEFHGDRPVPRYLSRPLPVHGHCRAEHAELCRGLAREGFIPFVHTFAVFIYRRAYDQIAMSVAYPNLPVRMIGFLPGITTPGGATHQAIEDIAIMRALAEHDRARVRGRDRGGVRA